MKSQQHIKPFKVSFKSTTLHQWWPSWLKVFLK